MNLLHPGMALAALAAVSVPIVIHLLLRRRRRVIQWAAMDLLKRAMQRDRRRQRVERWLLLAARCLLIAIAGIALAQPFVKSSEAFGGSVRTVWLVIDDGVASAERLPDGSTALERSTAEGRRMLESLGAADRVGVISAAAPVRRLVDPPTADKTRLDSLLSQMSPADTGSDLSAAIRSAAEAARESEEAGEIVLLSGFRRGSLDPSSMAPSVDAEVNARWTLSALEPLSGFPSNAWMTRAEAIRTGEESGMEGDRTVRVQIERRSEALPRSVRRVTSAGPAAGAADIALDAGERRGGADLRLRRDGADAEESGAASISLELDHDAQPRDDRLFAVLPSEHPARVVVLDRRGGSVRDLERLGSGVWMARALDPGKSGALQVDEVDPGSLDRAMLKGADAAIVARPDLVTADGWKMLREFVAAGAALLVTPSPDDSGQRWTESFRSSLAPSWTIDPEVEGAVTAWRLAPQQPSSATLRQLGSEISVLAAPVSVSRRIRIAAPPTDAEAALVFDDSTPMLLCGRPGGASRGWVALLACAPELSWTDLPVRPLMVPLLQEVVRQGRALATMDAGNLVGAPASLPRGAAALEIVPPAGSEGAPRGTAILPAGADGRTRDPVLAPGLHRALDDSGRPIGTVAVNVDPARASIEPNDPGAVLAWLERSGSWRWRGDGSTEGEGASASADAEASWSIWLLGAAVALALLETIMARLLSRSDATERGA
ncbi:MAG: VWA domain-containing protein [Phycisphaerae bacterium]|nr:VWA domain-containing protein [Phycisphaerae bacterium]